MDALRSTGVTVPAIVIRGSQHHRRLHEGVLRGAPPEADPDTFTGARGARGRRRERHDQEPARRAATRSACSRGAARKLHITGARPQLQLEAAALQPRRAREPARLDVVSPQRQGRVARQRRRDLPRRLRRRRDRSHDDRPGTERPDAGAIERREDLEQQLLVPLRASASALYRASDNTIQHNRVDWCVRGYSHTFYNRGQDSAGILIYEQSNRNIVAFNSVTHGGDGLFLWAGQSTMDSGAGRRERQRVLRQRFQLRADQRHRGDLQPQRLLRQPRRGVLARPVGRLQLRLVDRGEPGSRATSRRSPSSTARTTGSPRTASTATRPRSACGRTRRRIPNWGYPKTRDTRSRDYVIAGNTFVGNTTALKIAETQNVRVLTNGFEKVGTVAALTGDTRNFGVGDEVTVPVRPRPTCEVTLPKPMPGGDRREDSRGRAARARRHHRRRVGPVRLEIPEAVARGAVRRLAAEAARARTGGGVEGARPCAARPSSPRPAACPGLSPSRHRPGPSLDFDIQLAYSRRRGIVSRAARLLPRVRRILSATRATVVPADWRVRYFTFDETAQPDKNADAFARVLAGRAASKPNIATGSTTCPAAPSPTGCPAIASPIVAEAEIDLPPGQLHRPDDLGRRDPRVDGRRAHHRSLDAARVGDRHGRRSPAADAGSKWSTTRSAGSPSFVSRY